MNQTRAIITQLLQNIGSGKEVDQYLKQFSAVESTKFAVIKVRGDIARDDLVQLCSALTFLYRVGLYPIVVQGGGAQLDDALRDAGKAITMRDGLRVVDAETLRIARRTLTQVNHNLVDALEEMGTRARAIPAGVFEAEAVDLDRYGYHGHVTGSDLDPIRAAIKSGHLPILSSFAESPTGQLLLVHARTAALTLARRIQPAKIIFLTPRGGLTDGEGRLIRSLNLAEDYDWLLAQPWVDDRLRVRFESIKELLDALPLQSSVAMTSPGLLPRELFTHRGSGTLIRRGERVNLYEFPGALASPGGCRAAAPGYADGQGFDAIDVPRLRALLEECFARPLVGDYFDKKAFYRIYVTESYRATAILTCEQGLPYLDKFAVDERAQGEGLGSSLWERVHEDNPRLFWRSRVDNTQINPWYFSRAEGSLRSKAWVVFWYGLDGFDEVQAAIAHALAMPASLGEGAARRVPS